MFFTNFAENYVKVGKRLGLYFLMILTLLASCDLSLTPNGIVDSVDSIRIQRYDRVEARYLTTGDFAALQEMNTDYPTETRALIEDLLRLGNVHDVNINRTLLEFYQDTTLQNIVHAAESEYADMSDLTKDLKKAFSNLKRLFPNAEIPKFYAQIGALDQSIVVDDKAIGISLDKYLGKDYPTYLRFYDESQRESMTREYIVPDVLVFYLLSHYHNDNLDGTSQIERDKRMGVIMYAANKLLERNTHKGPYIDKVSKYMRKHPHKTVRDLLLMTDYSAID